MPSTFAEELAREGQKWQVYATISSIGRRTGATTAALRTPYRLCQQHPYDAGWTAADSQQYQALLEGIDGQIGESLDLRSCEVSLGELSLILADFDLREVVAAPGATVQGWDATDPITDWLMVHAPATRWQLNADVSTVPAVDAEETWTLISTAGLVQWSIYQIGAESVTCSEIVNGTQAKFRRASLGTRVQTHATALPPVSPAVRPPGDGYLYNRPQHLLGRYVDVWLAIWDQTQYPPVLQAEALHRRIWRGQVADYTQLDGGRWSIRCSPLMGRLDHPIGRQQCHLTARYIDPAAPHNSDWWWGAPSNNNPRGVYFPDGYTLDLTGWVAQGSNLPIYYPDPGQSGHYFHARMGQQLIECCWTTTADRPKVVSLGLLGTAEEWTEQMAVDGAQFHDVLLTSPAPGGSGLCYFQPTGGGNPYDDPVDIALALMTSRLGDYANGAWDCLPYGWGAGIPVTEIDLTGFARYRGLAQCPGLVIGWDGKGAKLRPWLTQYLLGPLGLWLGSTDSQQITLRSARDYYPLDSWAAILETDFVRADDGGRDPLIVGQLQQTITSTSVALDFDLHTGRALQSITYRHQEQRERYEESAGDIAIDGHAFTAATGGAPLANRCPELHKWFGTPRPILQCSIGIHRIADTLTDGVLVTDRNLADPDSGARGLTSKPGLVLKRAPNVNTGLIDLDIMLLGSPLVGYWAPSATVTSATRPAGGPPYTWTLDCNANDYSEASGGPPGTPIRDVLGFVVGDILQRQSTRGVIGSVNIFTVTAVEPGGVANRLTCQSNDATASGGWTGVVTFCHWFGGSAPATAWTASMIQRGIPQASGVPPVLPGAPTTPRVYGS